MTADDIITANPHLTFRPQRIGQFNGLAYVAEDGVEQWVMWKGESSVIAPGPWSGDQIKVAKNSLVGAQPGLEFSTKAADDYARAFRLAGAEVVKGPDNEPHVVFKKHGV